MRGKRWNIVGVYVSEDMQEKSEELRELIEENKEGKTADRGGRK